MFYKLFYIILLVCFVDQTSAAIARASNQNCQLPEHPAFGRYSVAGSAAKHKPNDVVPAYTILQYSCEEGYFVTNNISYCHNGEWSTKPECQKRKVICYFPNWATYRKDQSKFDVEDIDPNLCTHLIFAFVRLSDEPGIDVGDKWNNLYDNYGRGAFSRFVGLKDKNPNVKAMVALGGWSEGSEKFSQAFNTTEKRNTFIKNAVDFLLHHGFDGLDIVWEFPTLNGGAPTDKNNFIKLIKDLRKAFDEHNLILSAVVAAPEYLMRSAYDPKELGKYLDFINIKAYDLHGAWEGKLGIRSPLFPAAEEIGTDSQGLNIHSVVESWIKYGAPAHKLILGVGLFGRTFNITSMACKLPRCASSGTGAPGKWTNEAGVLGFNEICLLEKDSSAVYAYDKEAMAPFLVKDNLWVGYDNKQSIEQKVNYLLYNSLGGVALWSLDTDDFNGECGDGKFPLASFVHQTVIKGVPTGPRPKPFGQERKKPTVRQRNSAERVVVCYYASWSVYRKDDGKMDVENINPNLCTHLVFAYVGISDDIGIKVRDPWNDLLDNYGRGALIRFTKLKDANPNLVTLLAIGGYGESSEKFSQSVDTPEKRSFFVQNSVQFLMKYGFDGLDIDWEFPGQRGGKPQDKENFSKLLKALREEYDKHSLLLTAVVAATQVHVLSTYDVKALGKYLDYIHLKSFDMHGHWNTETGHNSPLYGKEGDRINVDSAIKIWLENGAPANKIVMGVGAYGRSFTLSSTTCNRPGCPIKRGGIAGKWTNDVGLLGYNEICLMERDPETTTSFDIGAKVPYLQKGDQWVSYDNAQSIKSKIDYIKANNLGGALIWTIDTDDFNGACGEGKYPLIAALSNALLKEEIAKVPTDCYEDKSCPIQPPTRHETTETTTVKNIPTTTTESSTGSGCPLPEFPFAGQYEVGNYGKEIVPGVKVPPYTLLTFSCKKNYVPSSDIAFCQDDFTWSTTAICNRRCRMPQSHTVDFTCWDNSQNPIVCGDYVPSETVVRYQCKHYHNNANFYNYHMTCEDGVFDYAPPRCVPECGAEPSEGDAYVIDGHSAKRGSFPWHAAIYKNYNNPPDAPDYQQICGGTLITTHLVVSAAHCFYLSNVKRTDSPSAYAVASGKFTRDWYDKTDESNPFVQKSNVTNIYIPLSYSGDAQNHQSDIAILELQTPIEFSDAVHPICINLNNDDLNRHQLRTNSVGKVAGWGLTAEAGDPSIELKFLNVPIIDYSECREELDKFNFGKYLTLDKLCAGYRNGSSVCKGDSGGGLVFPHRDTTESVQRWYLRGIVSVGPRNDDKSSCRRNTYTAYTQVHYFKEWISKKFVELKV